MSIENCLRPLEMRSDGEYIVVPQYKSAGAVIAEVDHVLRNNAGGRLFTPVAQLSAFIHSGEIEGFSQSPLEYSLLGSC